MLTPEQLSGFLIAAVLITAAPGPDNVMVLGIGISKGRKQGMIFGLGCAVGCLSHTFMAVIGVSAVIAASATAFSVLKICGGLYLIWLGANALRSGGAAKISMIETTDESSLQLFIRGVFANAINPKVILFFLSFLPQFVVPEHGQIKWQMAALGIAFTAQAAVLFGLLGLFSGSVGQWLNAIPRASLWLNRVAGTVFCALGLKLIVSR